MKEYSWKQISQWGQWHTNPNVYKKYKTIYTDLCKDVLIVYMLVKNTETGSNTIHSEPVPQSDVTQEMIDIADNF